MEAEQDHLCFIHLNISVSCNKVMTIVYNKPPDSHLCLHSTSWHKSSSINNIRKVLALRFRRIFSTTEEYKNKAKELFSCKKTQSKIYKVNTRWNWQSTTFCCETEKVPPHQNHVCNIFGWVQSMWPKFWWIY